jgi:hypothetical protein
MAVAGLIGLVVILIFLLFWSVASATAFYFLVRVFRWKSVRSGFIYRYKKSLCWSSMLLAANVLAVGLMVIILAGGVSFFVERESGKIINANYVYVFIGLFLLLISIVGQWLATSVLLVPGFWSSKLFGIPLGVAVQLVVFTCFHTYRFVDMNQFPERYEKEGSSLPSHPSSSIAEEFRIRPSGVRLLIPANHILYIHRLKLPEHLQTYGNKFYDRVETGFLLPEFGILPSGIRKTLNGAKMSNLLIVRIFDPDLDRSLDINKAWEAASLKVDTHANRLLLESGLLEIRDDQRTGLTEYHYMNHRWLASENIAIRCMGWRNGLEIMQPCEATYIYPNGLAMTYSFPYERIAEWERIDYFVKSIYNSYSGQKLE